MLATEALVFDRVLRKKADITRKHLYSRTYRMFDVGQDHLNLGDLADAAEVDRHRTLRYARLEEIYRERTTSSDYIRRLTGQ